MAMAGYTRRDALRTIGAGAAGLAAASAWPSLGSAAAPGNAATAISGRLQAWDWSDAPFVPGERIQAEFYKKYFPSLYKNLKFTSSIFGYSDMLPKLTVAWRASNRPDVARVAVAWSPQFVSSGQCLEITEDALGIPFSQFLPSALLSLRRNGASSGPLYGVPTNNEAMLLIYNKSLFARAGLDPDKPPATWADLVAYSKTIHDKTGAYGYGLCGAQNNGNTPYRFMPMAWAYGGQIFDELDPHPTWRKIGIGGAGIIEALSLYRQMYNVDKSVQPSALSDNESNVQTLFLDEKIGMVIDHPAFPQQVRQLKPGLQMGGALLPSGPVRRAVVLGGSNMHIRATTANRPAALALVKAYLAPQWNARLGYASSSEASTEAARASKQEAALYRDLPFNDIVFKMLPYGVNVPLVTQGGQIWNSTIPGMIQQVLGGSATPKQAATAAADQVRQMMAA